ncbi:hypothetical protein HYDPIDRAFT_27155 [Hydnomerulius pinastri MD-312]|nr:hypothetical protein HYDPIDRAFT_27155 [Hydnomerulius pinastri MD-312]
MSDTTNATSPFDHAKADIILRSSDNIDFRVFKLFLSLASPFFETLFDIPQPIEESEKQEVKDGLPVIPVSEDSKTLDALLRFCYPCTLAEDPKLEDLKDVIDVLEAAKKYSLNTIEKKAAQAISNPKILEVEPLRCFAIAHRGRLRDKTLLAAKYTLRQPLIPTWFEEIELLTATDLLALLTYHHKCGNAVHALKDDLSWMKKHFGSKEACSWLSGHCYNQADFLGHPNRTSQACGCPRSASPKYNLFGGQNLQWWNDFMQDTFLVLRDKPCGATIEAAAEEVVKAVRKQGCRACSPGVVEGMRGFSAEFARKVEEVVSQFELELKF